MLTLDELKKRHQYRGWGEIEYYYDRKLDYSYMVFISAIGSIMTIFDIILALGN